MAGKSDGFPENGRLIENRRLTENLGKFENRRVESRWVESFVCKLKKIKKRTKSKHLDSAASKRNQDETSFATFPIEKFRIGSRKSACGRKSMFDRKLTLVRKSTSGRKSTFTRTKIRHLDQASSNQG